MFSLSLCTVVLIDTLSIVSVRTTFSLNYTRILTLPSGRVGRTVLRNAIEMSEDKETKDTPELEIVAINEYVSFIFTMMFLTYFI